MKTTLLRMSCATCIGLMALIGVQAQNKKPVLSPPEDTSQTVNGKTISDAIADPTGRIAKALIAGATDRELIEQLYLSTMSRVPTPNELDQGITYLRAGDSRAGRAQDLLWALVNSKAFLYNR